MKQFNVVTAVLWPWAEHPETVTQHWYVDRNMSHRRRIFTVMSVCSKHISWTETFCRHRAFTL